MVPDELLSSTSSGSRAVDVNYPVAADCWREHSRAEGMDMVRYGLKLVRLERAFD